MFFWQTNLVGPYHLTSRLTVVCTWLGGGWAALDATMDLFRRYGPNDGNPATDEEPEFVFNNLGSFASTFELRTQENLGNLVPIV